MSDENVVALGLLTEDQTATRLGVKPQTLAVWRSTKRYGLRYVKVGHLVRYFRKDIEEWLLSRIVESGGNGGAAAEQR